MEDTTTFIPMMLNAAIILHLKNTSNETIINHWPTNTVSVKPSKIKLMKKNMTNFWLLLCATSILGALGVAVIESLIGPVYTLIGGTVIVFIAGLAAMFMQKQYALIVLSLICACIIVHYVAISH